ncbi:MAG: type IX secretion system membrane protein PorP/SprF [Saprospiraceae bacterium]|jgi:type IX secretion system PorP/SprF family membrane protein|nr:type IX secretion system membrane protein PorP/SprF [Saprospiraceae bacterium]MBK9994668.1 type IX secretion system membrane protein PorP/SprF [Saprospiraceae bacterium]
MKVREKSYLSNLYIVIFSVLFGAVNAQDPIFSQYFASPIHLNPAFTGLSEAPRFGLNYRNQLPLFGSYRTYVTYSATYDQYFESLKSGFGIQLLSDEAGEGILKNNKVALLYGYRIPMLRKGHYLKGGLEFGIVNFRYDWDQFVFGDQIQDLETGAIGPGGTPYPSDEIRPTKTSDNYFDIGAGALYYTPDFYIGLSAKHINTPENDILKINQSAYDGLPVRWVFHGGFNYYLSRDQEKFLSPALMVAKQSKFFQVNVGANYNFSMLFAGLWYRHTRVNSDALIFLVGFQKEKWKLGYSFDFTTSSLGIEQGGSHELSLLVQLKKNPKKKSVVSDCFKAFQ